MKLKQQTTYITAIFFVTRVILFISSPLEILPGYGDYWNFFQQAEMGWPFIDYWTEFPPIFPIINRLLFITVSGRQQAYYYALALVISIFQAGCVWLVGRLESRLYPKNTLAWRTAIYAFLTIGLFYSWSYFDPLAVYFMLLAMVWLLEGKDGKASCALSLGILVKWFPILVLPAMWKIKSKKTVVRNLVIIFVIVLITWGGLYLLNGEMTKASLISQANKGSWETIWALIDGNIKTGNFDPAINRRVSETALNKSGNAPVIPSWLTLLFFGGFGVYLFIKANLDEEYKFIAFVGLTAVIFFLWSPGYSPQWILYLIPFILLVFPMREGVLFSLVLLLINLLEWPILLSRGLFWSLNYLIPLRTFIMILLGIRLYSTSDGLIEKSKQVGRIEY